MSQLRSQAEAQTLQRDVAQLKEQVLYLRTAQEQMFEDLETLRSTVGVGDRTTAARIDALEAAAGESVRSQQQMKAELVKTLSQRIAEVIAKHAPSRPDYSAGGFTAREHIVKRGETLSAIAAAYGAKVQAVVQANGLRDADAIREGQKLLIPE